MDVAPTNVRIEVTHRSMNQGQTSGARINGQFTTPINNRTIVNGQANDVDGFTVEFRQELSPKWNVGIAYGQENYDLPTSTGTLSLPRLKRST